MVSSEFKLAVANNDILLTRIMLKDALILDPTFEKFDEMMVHVRRNIPDILVPFDGDYLENDRNKWDIDVMNRELVQLLDNFSEIRIKHLKQVVSVVLAQKAQQIRNNRVIQKRSNDNLDKKYHNRMEAWVNIKKSTSAINNVIQSVGDSKILSNNDIVEIEKKANQILRFVSMYRRNK